MLNMGVSLKALLGVRAGGALAKKTNLQPVVVTQTMCVVLGSFWSLHLDSSFCSGVTAEADVCCRDLCENQDSFIGSSSSCCLHQGVWGHCAVLQKIILVFPQLFQGSAWSTEVHPKCLYQAHMGSVSLC